MTYNPNGPDLHEIADAYDAFDDAMSDDPRYFAGYITVEAFVGFFEKGKRGGTVYEAEVHGDRKHYTIIEINVAPLDPTKKMIPLSTVKWAAEFKKIVRPSIEQLAEQIAAAKPGLVVGEFNTLREISGLWVVGERVPRPDNKEDEDYTTLKFLDVFATEEECAEAAAKIGLSGSDEQPVEPPARNNGNGQARTAMAGFLPALWVQAGKDPAKMEELIAANPMLAEHFDLDSPEVQEVMA